MKSPTKKDTTVDLDRLIQTLNDMRKSLPGDTPTNVTNVDTLGGAGGSTIVVTIAT